MKIKILIAIALIAMIGTASAAYNMVITDPASTILVPGDTTGITFDVDVSDVATTPSDLHSVIVDVTSGTSTDLEFQFVLPDATTTAWASANTQYTWTNSSTSQSIKMKVRAIASLTDPPGTTYEMKASIDGIPPNDKASATTYATAIPEFPTIALPVAAILGLAFIFQRRKEEE